MPGRKTANAGDLSGEAKKKLYYYMLLTRECDRAILTLYKKGAIVGGAFTGYGNEATAVGSAFVLASQDYLFPMHRDLGAHLVKGESLRAVFLQQLARRDGLTRGRDGTGHYADPALRIYGNVSHLAAMIPVAVGVALASKLRHEGAVVMNYIGDGGSNVGEFHEGVNMAAVMELPFVLVIENNQYAYSTPTTRQYKTTCLSQRAAGYGIPGLTVDGTDVMAVYRAASEAVERARNGGGPSLIEAVTMRMHGHSAADDASYVPPAAIEEWKKKDPLARFSQHLSSSGIMDEAEQKRMADEIQRLVENAAAEAEADPYPEASDASDGVYAR